MELMLAGIPVGRDIGVASPKHRQNLVAIAHIPPNRIGPRHMAVKSAKGATLLVEIERDVVGVQTVGAVRHQNPEWMTGNEVVQNVGAVFLEMGGDIHGRLYLIQTQPPSPRQGCAHENGVADKYRSEPPAGPWRPCAKRRKSNMRVQLP